MGLITHLTEFFCFSLAIGVTGYSFLADSKDTGVGFIKVITAITGVALMLATSLHVSYSSWLSIQAICYYVALIMTAITYFFHRDGKTWPLWIVFIVQIGALIFLLFNAQNHDFFAFSFFFSSAALLGIVTYTMVLGHWYLVTPRLSEKPLARGMYILWALLLIKLTMTGFWLVNDDTFFNQGATRGMGYMFNWIMLTMRVGWGYLVIGIMSYFAWRLIRMRSTQSATGILYAMTFFVFVGELVSIFLHYKHGMYI